MSDELFERLAAEMAEISGVDQARMFGHPALMVRGKMFACGYDGDLVVKIGAERVAELAEAGMAKPFNPRGTGRPMGGWAQLPPPEDADDLVEWLDVAAEAHAYTASTA